MVLGRWIGKRIGCQPAENNICHDSERVQVHELSSGPTSQAIFSLMIKFLVWHTARFLTGFNILVLPNYWNDRVTTWNNFWRISAQKGYYERWVEVSYTVTVTYKLQRCTSIEYPIWHFCHGIYQWPTWIYILRRRIEKDSNLVKVYNNIYSFN